MNVIPLSTPDLLLAAVLVLALATVTAHLQLRLGKPIIIAAVRTAIQLLLVGLVLRALFSHAQWYWVALMSIIMLLVASREVAVRQERGPGRRWAFGASATTMFISSFALTGFALSVVIGVDPWYAPRYAIPLLGMLLGNTMTGVTLAMSDMTQCAWQQRLVIEQRLLLGANRNEAIEDIRRQSARTGMIPTINAMAAAGIVSLPGMMTGQLLAGSSPYDAVRYQILIMFLIAASTGFAVLMVQWLVARQLFDERERLRLDRLTLRG
ncbi:MAG: iron export ABC transporter permease subunit FetB [Gammaproteobacteria bacterium]|nr:iron export ABC transporter permease subunit FetB [Gammaproteobacteria bacterium]